MTKPFLSFEEQINILEQDKCLVISDRTFAENMLKRIGYFSLIGGYKGPFKNPATNKFKNGTTFESIVALYKLDENLRELFLKYILQIERHIRSLLSYYFCEKYGENQSNYLNSTCFTDNPRRRDDVIKLIEILNNLANYNCNYPYINHQRNTYGNVPLWVLTGALSFGTLSKFYTLITSDLRVKISKNFDGVNEKQLGRYLSVVTKFRNVCAHNERLFSYKTQNAIPDTALHHKLLIPQKDTQFTCGKRDLFAVVIAFRYLLPDSDFKKFKQRISRILLHYLNSSYALNEDELYRLMGFPTNWQKITRFRK